MKKLRTHSSASDKKYNLSDQNKKTTSIFLEVVFCDNNLEIIPLP